MDAAILTIGDELLNGQTVDTNSAWIGQQLNKIGVQVTTKLSVGDTEKDIIEGLNYAFLNSRLVIVTGGLGPTHDDITKKVLADYFDDKLVFHEPSFERIKTYFNASGRVPREAHRLQCYMPSNCTLLLNKRGTAPGMWFEKNETFLLSMPGVPSEMKGIMEDLALAKISSKNPDQYIKHFIIQTIGIGETSVAEKIADIIEEFPTELGIAYLPGVASVKLRLTGKGSDRQFIDTRVEFFGNRIMQRIQMYVFGLGDTTIEEVVGKMAKERGISIGTAESCTGGLIAARLTSISGSSAYYKGSVVAYSNDVKSDHLNVSRITLMEKGAVSEATVSQMVAGLIEKLSVDVAVAVSGIAGPTGGTKEKPVGTIWIAVGNKNQTVTRMLQLTKNRDLNIQYTVAIALDQLRLFMANNI